MELVLLIAVTVAFGVVLWILNGNYQKTVAELKEDIKVKESKIASLGAKEREYISLQSELHAQLQVKDEQLRIKEEQIERGQKEIVEVREQLNKDFQILANKILEEKSEKFTETNKVNIEAILKPLNERLQEFKTQVAETYDKESKQRFSLEERIKDLVKLNNQISEEANNLTKALKGDSKVQGNWGEMILESILERSGLKKGEQYLSQEYITGKDGRPIRNSEGKYMQPDVVVKYPGNRHVVIDSKVSLTAYSRYSEADNDQQRVLALKEHITSIKRHINELSAKSYQDYVDSVDFVMMFIPNEPAFIIAMQNDSSLWDYAYSKRILLISPTNLIASLKVVEDLWIREQQSENAQKIAERGALMYNKFVGFVESLQDIGANIERTQKAYDKATRQLSDGPGNLIRQVEMLKELGVKSDRELPDI